MVHCTEYILNKYLSNHLLNLQGCKMYNSYLYIKLKYF